MVTFDASRDDRSHQIPEQALIFEHLDQIRRMLLYITTEAEPSGVVDAISPDSDGEVSVLLDGRGRTRTELSLQRILSCLNIRKNCFVYYSAATLGLCRFHNS
jgi:hypothetical protein